ncbi:WD40 repeat domain-containing protein [Nostoc sp.]|uniref:WD40 repeat domain-containing protein n=1 Tax=Nostoc sp. TaxID=1180 RepID=UPI002FFA7F63
MVYLPENSCKVSLPIAFSPDSNFLASGSYDRTIKIWDVHSGECLQTLPGHPGCVLVIAFSPDGKTLISNSAVARMKQSIAGILLQGNAGQLYNQPVEGMIITAATGLTEGEVSTLKALGAVEMNSDCSIDVNFR